MLDWAATIPEYWQYCLTLDFRDVVPEWCLNLWVYSLQLLILFYPPHYFLKKSGNTSCWDPFNTEIHRDQKQSQTAQIMRMEGEILRTQQKSITVYVFVYSCTRVCKLHAYSSAPCMFNMFVLNMHSDHHRMCTYCMCVFAQDNISAIVWVWGEKELANPLG